MIRVRFAERADQSRVVEFIHDHWSATHIFVERPAVLAWQHQQPDGRLNAVIAEDADAPGAPLIGMLGFIPTGQFDPDLGDRDVALAIWKVREEGVPPGLGLRLLKFLQSELQPRLIMAIGISDIVVPIYKVLRYEVGVMHQSALFHPDRADAIAVAAGVPAEAFLPSEPTAATVRFVAVDDNAPADLVEAIDAIGRAGLPAKSVAYLTERYLRHPWYLYEVRAVVHHDRVVGVIVWRAVEVDGHRVLRIVDIVGDVVWLGDGAGALRDEVVAADAEYIDLVQWGIDPGLLAAAGFVDPANHPGLVIPNYFSPFEQRNVEIGASVRIVGSDQPLRMFRADSDQDRPNRAVEVPADDRSD